MTHYVASTWSFHGAPRACTHIPLHSTFVKHATYALIYASRSWPCYWYCLSDNADKHRKHFSERRRATADARHQQAAAQRHPQAGNAPSSRPHASLMSGVFHYVLFGTQHGGVARDNVQSGTTSRAVPDVVAYAQPEPAVYAQVDSQYAGGTSATATSVEGALPRPPFCTNPSTHQTVSPTPTFAVVTNDSDLPLAEQRPRTDADKLKDGAMAAGKLATKGAFALGSALGKGITAISKHARGSETRSGGTSGGEGRV